MLLLRIYIVQRYRAGIIVISKACSVLLLRMCTHFIESCLWTFVTIPIFNSENFQFTCSNMYMHIQQARFRHQITLEKYVKSMYVHACKRDEMWNCSMASFKYMYIATVQALKSTYVGQCLLLPLRRCSFFPVANTQINFFQKK